MYTAYYYDPTRDQFPGFDSNELSVCGKFVSMITEVRSSKDLSDLAPRTKTEQIILIVSEDCPSTLTIDNFNPCPEELE